MNTQNILTVKLIAIGSLALCLASSAFAQNLGTSSGNSAGSFTAGATVDGQLSNSDTSVDSQVNADTKMNSDADAGPSGSMESEMSTGSALDQTPGSTTQSNRSNSAQTTGSNTMTTDDTTSGPTGTDVNMELENGTKIEYPNSTDQSQTDPIAPLGQ